MDAKQAAFLKSERLSSKHQIDRLFAEGASLVAFPLRMIYLPVKRETTATVSVLVGVPKRNLRRAVDRNLVKRRIRESYRQRKPELIRLFAGTDIALLVAFLYLGKEIQAFERIDKAMAQALSSLQKTVKANASSEITV
jgi:ribonuclease P protein component